MESLEMYSSSEDCFSTSSTMVSELDYWASSDPLFAMEDWRHDARLLASRPVFGRCSSLGSPAHSGLTIRRALSSPYQQEDACIARFQAPWSFPDAKAYSRQLPSPKPYLPAAVGLAALTAS
ncbi:unnamed protein product [Phytophthora fragariaefolia]|uniref:Unnamed protein product n=1 Tax=Phytophthora fragariaefolia TaxID=1490495 RepID=A0A9W6TVX7_9STRA|nr:unnamed protein product [Phytophthora fragariaefolia]